MLKDTEDTEDVLRWHLLHFLFAEPLKDNLYNFKAYLIFWCQAQAFVFCWKSLLLCVFVMWKCEWYPIVI